MNEQLDTAGAVAAYLNPTRVDPDPAQGARVGVSVGLGANPDYEAELKQVARRTGVPVDTVRAYPDELKRQAQMGAIDFNGLAERFPRTAGFLAGVENAKIAHDDIENMGLVETLVNSARRGIPALKSILPSVAMVNQASGLDMYRKIDDRIAAGEDPKKVLGEYGDYGLAPLPWQSSEQALAGWNAWKAKAVANMQKNAGESAAQVAGLQAERNAIPLPGVVNRVMAAKTWGGALSEIASDPVRFVAAIGPESLVQSAPGLLAAIPAGMALGPGGAAATIGGNSFIVDYASTLVDAMQSAGIDTTDPEAIRLGLKDPAVLAKITDQAVKHASVVGAFDALSGGIAGEMVLPKKIAGKLATRPLAQEMANIALQVPVQGTLGGLGELGGELYAGQEIQPGNVLAEVFGEFFGTPSEVVSASAKRIRERIGQARQAEQDAQTIAGLNELANASKVLARDPQTFEQFVAQAAEGGPVQQVFIDANTLMQSGVAEQVAAVSPAVATQLAEAAQTGGQIAIPVGEYTARIAPTEYAQSLLDHLKVEPEGFSRAEAQEYMQSHADELKAEVERTLAEKQGDETFKQSTEAVRAEVKAQLDAAARFIPQVNDAYSSMVGNFYAVQAAKLGVSPEEMFKRYPLRIGAERITNAPVFDQGDVARTDRIDEHTGLPLNEDGTVTVYHHTSAENAAKIRKEGRLQSAGEPDLYFTTRAETDTGYGDTAVPVRVRPDRLQLDDEFPDGRQDYRVESPTRGRRLRFLPDGSAVLNQAPAVDTPEFAKWFNGSKITDKQGAPLVMYHSTAKPFEIFDESKRSDGFGFYFATSERKAKKAAKQKGVTLPVFISAKNVYGSQSNPLVNWLEMRYDGKGRQLAEQGYDAIWVKDEGGASLAVRYPEQIKSVNNRGTFDPADANIMHQNKGGPRGSFNPETLSITLLKDADLSTFLHESGHFFLEVQADIASKLQQEADIFGRDTLKPGERQILDDADALLRWFGVESLAEWYNLDFEEKRAYHEKFARGFESYLFEGKAPSIEMQGLFQRFRAWLLNVYRDMKNLNVELTDEVRGVFDRMLASTDEIRLAEQGRSMTPLFTSPEQAGMTPEEFAAYQALGVDSTNDAIQDLQARGLRDMTWLHNARGRIIKQLQKDAKAQRAEVQIEVRREVMSQPIYRAWQFLTGKLTADDKIAPVDRPKSDPDAVDTSIDSLFTAIAKLGGISRESAAGLWDVKPEDKPQSGVFGKPVLRRNGGLTIDQMAERLAELGYLDPDEDGNTALSDFEDAFYSELGGSPVYSRDADYDALRAANVRPGDQVVNLEALGAGRLDAGALAELGLPAEVVNVLKARRMTASNGLHPDIVAEMFGFTSGDELVRKLAEAETPRAEIEALTDVRMLEQFGELSSPEAIERAADMAIHNDARARFVATEANALAKATGQRKVLASAAKEYASAMIARLKVRDIKPGQYASAEVRAAKAAEKASKSGDIATAAAEKRNQLIQIYATRAAYDAQEEVDKGLRYLKKFEGDIKSLAADYADQIGNLLERFDLRKGQSNKAIDKRAALAEWIKAQREAGFEPDIPAELENEAFRKSYKDMKVEEFRGLVDTVKQIEHLGRLKHKLLTAADQRAYEAVRDEIAASIHQHAQGREADTRTPTTNMGRAVQGLKRFWAAHIKAATWARVMDGGKDGGPMWEYFVRSANERGDMETTMRAEATAKLSEILAPVLKLGKMGGKGQFFPSIGRSLNREARLAIAMNMGNEGNTQRLLGGEGWTLQQLTPVLQSLTAQEWQAVQAVWDHFESYRPQIAAKERRIYGKEPKWVEPRPFAVTTADGTTVQMRGGYYPIKYDPAASQRAEEHADAESAKRQLQGAYTTATTRRSFTKSRAEEVSGRPLLYTLSGLYSGVNDVIHDLAWHEWLIDTNRLLRSSTIDGAIREHYGPEAKQQFKTWAQDIAEGEKGADAAVDLALSRLRQGISTSGLGFNVMSAFMQPLGITQSITRVGAQWVGRGVLKYLAGPIDLTRQVNEMSDFMKNRARTRFRELNELRNQVQDQTAFKEMIGRYAYFLMMRCQQMVDVPTWWGAYEKAIAEGNEETRAVALADQAVIDAQGGGQTKDLSAIERGGPAQKLFTVFYSFMNTAMNIGVAQTMSADTPAKRAKLAVDYAMLYVTPAVLGYFLKAALTPGDAGDDDPEKLAKKLAANQLDYLMGLMVVVREFSEAAKTLTGANDLGRDYTGPAGLRLVADSVSMAKQAHQGEFDDGFRKASINMVGDLLGLPSAQINRTITGVKALHEGKTSNPAAVAFGYQEKR